MLAGCGCESNKISNQESGVKAGRGTQMQMAILVSHSFFFFYGGAFSVHIPSGLLDSILSHNCMFYDVDVHVEKTLTPCALDNESILMLLRLWQCWDSFFLPLSLFIAYFICHSTEHW